MVFLTADSSRSVCSTVLTIKVLRLDEIEVAYTFPTDLASYINIMDEKWIYYNKVIIKARDACNFSFFFFFLNLEWTGIINYRKNLQTIRPYLIIPFQVFFLINDLFMYLLGNQLDGNDFASGVYFSFCWT